MIMVIDTETTAIVPGQIAQISYILIDRQNTTAKNFYFAVDSFDPAAAAVNGLSVEKTAVLSDGKKFLNRAEEIFEDLESCGLFVAHNASFDFNYLRAEFLRLGLTLPTPEFLDTMQLFTPVCCLPRRDHTGYKYPKLTELVRFLQITEDRIETEAQMLFGGCDTFHDARFDTTAVYLAVREGRRLNTEIDGLLTKHGV